MNINDIIYMKLVNGDELFAKLVKITTDEVTLQDVMIMETIGGQDDAIKYMFMSRYTPYAMSHHTIKIDRRNIIMTTEVVDVVRTHYEKSLAYAQTQADEKFLEGIAEASTYLDQIIDKKESGENLEEQNIQDGSPTKH